MDKKVVKKITAIVLTMVLVLGMLPGLDFTFKAYALTTGTTDGTYDFGGLVDDGTYEGIDFKAMYDKFMVSRCFQKEGTVIYAFDTNAQTLNTTQNVVIKAADNEVCKQFTFEDLNLSYYGSIQYLDIFTLTLKDTDGHTIATHTLQSGEAAQPQIPKYGDGIAAISSFSFSSPFPSGGYSGVSEIDITFRTSGTAQSSTNLCFEAIKVSDISAAAPWDGSIATGFAGGNGSSGTPYQIATAEQLAYMASVINNSGTNAAYVDKCYILTADIDLNNQQWTPISTGNSASTQFSGTFDGNGHTISNLAFGSAASPNNTPGGVGLFSTIYGATIKNVGIVDANIFLNRTYDSVGTLAAVVSGTTSKVASIINCFATGSITDNGTGNNAGVLIGRLMYGTITKCYTAGSVSGGSDSVVGGLIGDAADSSYITSCYSTASATAGTGTISCAGGLIGWMSKDTSNVSNCYATGNIVCGNAGYMGGLVGDYNYGTISGCYYNSSATQSVSGAAQTAKGVGDLPDSTTQKTSDEMKDSGFVTVLNTGYSGTWTTDTGTNQGYPILLDITPASTALYKITYDGNENTSGTAPTDTGAYYSGTSVTLAANTGGLAKTGCTFGGWNTSSAGTGTNYNVCSADTITGNKTLYATWLSLAGAPIVTITTTTSSTTNASPIPVTITFSKDVTDFIVDDITVSNGAKSNFSGSGKIYTVDIAPVLNGPVTVNVAAGVAQDTSNNDNIAAMQLSLTYDGTAPSVTISSSSGTATKYSPIPITITFSEAVTGFTKEDISVTNGTKGELSGSVSGYSISVVPDGQGAVTVNIDAGVVQDMSGNGNSAAAMFSCTYDTVAPTVTITSTAANPTNTSPIPITVTFSDSVTGFTADDITVTNGTKGTLSGSGTTYTMNVTPSGQGAIMVDIVAGVAQDAAGNINTAATQFSITYDTTLPTLSAESASSVAATTATLNFTSSEAGNYYYLIYAAGDAAPNAATIKAQGTAAVDKGTAAALIAANTASAAGLTASTAYKAYVIVEDAALNASAVSTISFSTTAAAGTKLYPGDVVILAFNGYGSTDGFSFMPLVNLEAGTEINFTDYGWNSSTNLFNTAEEGNSTNGGNMITYTAPTDISAGTIIRQDKLNVGGTAFTQCSGWSYNFNSTNYIYSIIATLTGNDGILVFQGTPSDPTFIWGFHTGQWGQGSYENYYWSDLPTGLTNGTNAVCFADLTISGNTGTDLTVDDGQYIGLTTAATIAEWRARVANSANWTTVTDNSPVVTYPTGTYSVLIAPNVTTTTITTFDATSATLGGNVTVDGGATVTERGVVYSTTDNTPTIGEADVTKAVNGAGTGSFSASISSLAAGTTYYVQAYATNSAGTNYGAVQSFTTTVVDATPPTLSSESASSLAATTATLNFTSSEAGTYYYLIYAAGDTAPNAATIKAQIGGVGMGAGAASATANTASVTGLTASTAYKAYVIVEDAALNTSAVSTIAFSTTATPDTTPPTLSAENASSLAATTATLNFTSSEAGTYYYLIYAAGDAAPSAATIKAQLGAVKMGAGAASATVNTASVTGLAASTAYKAYVIVEDAALNTSAVSTIAFSTTATPDTTPPTLSAENASSLAATTATLNFTSSEAGTYYYLIYAAGDAAPSAATIKAQLGAVKMGAGAASATVNTASVTGLAASTAYKAYVIVEDAALNTSAVSTIAFSTTAAPDTTPPTLSAENASSLAATTATLNFTSSEAGNYYYLVYTAGDTAPNAATIKAQIGGVGMGAGAASATANTASVTELAASTAYKAYVIVEDAALNTSAVSTIAFLTTAAPDTTPPTLSAESASSVAATTAALNFTSDEVGTYYYLVYAAGDVAPDAATVKAQDTAVAKGTNSAVAAANAASVTELAASTAYKAYVIVEDAALNTSAVSTIAFSTTAAPDTTPPTLSAESASSVAATTAALNFTSDEAGTYYYLVYAAGDVAPDAATVKAQDTAVAKGTNSAVAAANAASVTELAASTAYKAYVIVEDAALNTSAVSTIAFSTTAAPDTTPPTLSAESASSVAATTAALNFTSDEAGTYYYLVYAAGDVAPDAATVKAQDTAVAKGTNSAVAAANAASVTGLTASTEYKAYVIVEDDTLNASEVSTIVFTTTSIADTTPAAISLESASSVAATTATLNFTSSEAGNYYYLIYAAGDTAPNAATIKAQIGGVGMGAGAVSATANTASVTGLTASTAYKAYVIVEDAALNTSAVSTIAFTTTTNTVTDSAISLTTASFDKKTSMQADVAVTMTLNGNALISIKNGTSTLTSGTNYTVSGTTVTILKAYLASQETGTVTLVFDFSAGNPQTLVITVSDSTTTSGDGGSSGGGSGGGSGGSTTSTPTPTPAPQKGDFNVVINGEKQEPAGTVSEGKLGDQSINTVTFDEKKLDAVLEKIVAPAQGQEKPVITVPVFGNSDIVASELNGQNVKDMENKEVVLEIKTKEATYTLPAQQINIDAISSQIGESVELKDIKVTIVISKATEDTVKVVENSAEKGEFTIVVPAVDFKINCTYNNKTVEVSSFNAYVERTVAIPEGIDNSKITTGIVIEPDGKVRHVPTKIIAVDGKYYAKINSLTNSTYSVVWHPLEFKDVDKHWAKEAINDMGSRMVINGVGNDLFDPDKDITRAEFATIIVKALGLKPGVGNNPFTDIKNTDWYCDFVKTAVEYKIISGYGNGEFGPTDKVTREQAMTIIANAMKITGLKVEFATGEIDKLLAKFGDADKSAAFAKDNIAICVKTGIISGRTGNLVAPKNNVTRAEVAVIIRKLLQKSNLI